MREHWRGLRTAVALSFRADPRRATIAFALTVFVALAGSLDGLWLRDLTNAVIDHDRAAGITAVALLVGVSIGLNIVVQWTLVTVRTGLEEQTGIYVDARLMELAGGVPGVEHHERPDYADKMELLRLERQSLAQTSSALVENIGVVVRLTTAIVLLASIDPVLALLPAFAAPSLWAAGRGERLRQRAQEQTTDRLRLGQHLFQLATAAESGKELRVFGFGQHLRRRYRTTWDDVDRVNNRAWFRAGLLAAAGWAVFVIGYVGAIAFVVDRAVHGKASTGDVVLAFTTAASVNQYVAVAANMVGWLVHTLRSVARYLWLSDYVAAADAPLDRPAVAPPRLRDGIRLEGVSFRYPGTDRAILSEVDLVLPAGATVAIVGDNGAGKSTLVKLLCRFYEPTAGRITVDGIALADISHDEWRARVAGGFQDFARFELLARHNVGVGDLPRLDDVDTVAAALARANAVDVVDALPRGLETQLGKQFDAGVELSGGQWQKLALGRAMMRDEPLLLVLDEPTASLDAETEHALFERYAGAARRAATDSGGITVLVSHRFSTVRMADLIVVVDAGGVREVGSHAELMARGDLYAELYELQARAYR